MVDIIEESKKFMCQQTKKNGAPCWLLTELAVKKGKELAKKHDVDGNLVVTSLYLAHAIFNKEKYSSIRMNHAKLNAENAKKLLNKWKISEPEKNIIINAIEAHHASVPTNSLTAEVVKNAECFKFVTVEGALIFLHDLGTRGHTFKEAVDYILEKMNQKLGYLTFDDCIKEAEENSKRIKILFENKHYF